MSAVLQTMSADLSGDYLSIKQQVTPTISHVYLSFKEYAEDARLLMEALLEDLRRYARIYEKLLTCKSGTEESRAGRLLISDETLGNYSYPAHF